MVRPARVEDIPALLDLAAECYREMDFDSCGYRFDAEVIGANFAAAVDNPRFVFLCSERDGSLDGIFFAAICDTTLYFRGRQYAQEVVWHSAPSLPSLAKGRVMLALLKEAENMLQDMPFYISTDVRSRFSAVGEYLQKRGYKEMCRYWHKGA